MKKIKISELPLYNSLKGLFTIGTDKDHRSVKVSLEFIETQTEAAAKTATDAAAVASTAAQNADAKATLANQAATTATTAAGTANKAAQTATTAANAADAATTQTLKAKQETEAATVQANAAAEAANTSKDNADGATSDAQEATENAIAATADLLKFLGTILPTALSVEAVPRLTLGNVYPVFINAVLSPSGVRQNIIFISDNKSVTVAPDGRLRIVGSGRSVVQVIPTINTTLAKVIEVEVGAPTVRLVNTRTCLRLTASGAFRMN